MIPLALQCLNFFPSSNSELKSRSSLCPKNKTFGIVGWFLSLEENPSILISLFVSKSLVSKHSNRPPFRKGMLSKSSSADLGLMNLSLYL